MRQVSRFALLLILTTAMPALAVDPGIDPPPHPSLPACVKGDRNLLLPDLVADPPSAVRTALKGGRRLVEFTTSVANIGEGPLIIEGRTLSTPAGVFTQGFQIIQKRDGSKCARHAGFFVYHPAHSHYHFEDFVDYELRGNTPDGPLATTGTKASYCLLDIDQVSGQNTPRQLTNQTCNSREGLQGISVGWKDVYERTLPDQNIDLDDPVAVPTGSYWVINNVDGRNRLWETNESNNRSSSPVSLSIGPSIYPTYPPQTTPTVRGGTPLPTPTRGRGRPSHPERAPRPTRRAFTPVTFPATPTPPPAQQTSTPQPTATATATRKSTPSGSGGSCPVTCPYALSQVRMTWYDAGSGGLNLSFFVRDGACARISPSTGDTGTLTMSNWLTERGTDTGRLHKVNLSMSSPTSGEANNNGTIHFTGGQGGTLFSYVAYDPPIAGPGLGVDFPVVFNLCVTVGDQTFAGRLVCQEKPRGLLCHEG